MASWVPLSFDDVAGWPDDDHVAALSCFRLSAQALSEKSFVSRSARPPSDSLLAVAGKALEIDQNKLSRDTARNFFEKNFIPKKYEATDEGFVTGYFEPVVAASRTKSNKFPYPIYRRPSDLVRLDEAAEYPKGLPTGLQYARQSGSVLEEYFDRGEIDKGALSGKGLELFWVESAVEAFFIHVQGSARLALEDGSTARISFAGKTGHPYTSIGKLLVERGIFTPQTANMANLRGWLEEDEGRALEVLHHNRSYIFFTEVEGHHPDFGPIAGAGVQLTPGRSLAIDKSLHPYGTPIWIDTEKPMPFSAKPFVRLMIAQDTGSAIVGPQRGDIFLGSGAEAGMIAGSVRHHAKFIILEAV